MVCFSCCVVLLYLNNITFSHLADAFFQSDLQMRTIEEAIKVNKRAICKCYDKSQLAERSTRSKGFTIYFLKCQVKNSYFFSFNRLAYFQRKDATYVADIIFCAILS